MLYSISCIENHGKIGWETDILIKQSLISTYIFTHVSVTLITPESLWRRNGIGDYSDSIEYGDQRRCRNIRKLHQSRYIRNQHAAVIWPATRTFKYPKFKFQNPKPKTANGSLKPIFVRHVIRIFKLNRRQDKTCRLRDIWQVSGSFS